jgi:hypothetical protein
VNTTASGNIFGVDSLEIGTHSLISISETRLVNSANNGSGFVQVIALQ